MEKMSSHLIFVDGIHILNGMTDWISGLYVENWMAMF